MATERSGEGTGLVRRLGAKAQLVVDESAPATTRAAAGGVVATVAAGTIAGGLGLFEAVDKLVIGNPVVGQLMTSDIAHASEWGLALAAPVAVAAFLITGVNAENRGAKGAEGYLAAHHGVGRVRAASLVIGGTAALLAGGVAGIDASGLAHLGALDSGLIDAAVAVTAGAGGLSLARLVTRIPARPAMPAKQLGE